MVCSRMGNKDNKEFIGKKADKLIKRGSMMDPVTIDYANIFTSVVNEAKNGITQTLPVVVPILGIMAAISLGVKIFKKLTGR